MKKILALFLLVISFSCSQGQYILEASWTKNTEPDISHYQFFFAEIPGDSLPIPNAVFVTGDTASQYQSYYIVDVPHIFGLPDSMIYNYTVDGSISKWVQAGLTAVDSAGNISLIAGSNLLWLEDIGAPNAVVFRRLKIESFTRQ